MQANDLRKGTKIIYQKDLYVVTAFSHHTPGNKRGFIQATLKSLTEGKIIQNKFSSTDNVERAILDQKKCQYLYNDQEGHHFMDMESYESFILDPELLGDGKYYLKENQEINIQHHDGKPIIPEFPKTVSLKVTESPEWVKGDSVSNNMKPAVTESGLKVQVPIFIKEGEMIEINTDTGEYKGRS